MGKILVFLFLIIGIGGYLYYVRGWDADRFKKEAVEQVPFLGDRSATTTPIGSRGTGTRWEFAADMPTPRADLGAAEIGGKIYAVGGIGAYGGTLSILEIYDIATDAWSEGPRMPAALHHPAVATDGERLFVFGGLTGLESRPTDNAYIYDPKLKQWQELPRLGDFRGAAAAVFLGKLGYVIGGLNQGGPTGSVERLDEKHISWQDDASLVTPRLRHASAALGGRIYVVGGDKGGIEQALDGVEVFEGSWSARASMPRARSGAALAAQGGKLYVFGGGSSGETFEAVDIYDPGANSWKTMHLVMPTPRRGLTAVPYQNRVYTIGGGQRTGFSVSDKMEVLILTP